MGNELNFGEAITCLKDGKKVTRSGWNGKGMFLFLEKEKDYRETVMRSHIVMKTVENAFVPWLASQTDMLAEDWSVVE